MALYLVSYDLNQPEQNYPELVEYLRLIGARKVLQSEWLVRTSAMGDAVYNGVKADLGSGDGIVSLTGSVGSREKSCEPAGRNLETSKQSGRGDPSIPLDFTCEFLDRIFVKPPQTQFSPQTDETVANINLGTLAQCHGRKCYSGNRVQKTAACAPLCFLLCRSIDSKLFCQRFPLGVDQSFCL
jgi:hypothetical protein